MLLDSRLHDMLSQLERSGFALAPEELCKDCPELLDELKRRVAQLHAVRDVLEPASPASGDGADESITDPVPPTLVGYRIEGFLGEGGMGTVWRAVQTGTGREVALKVMRGANLGSRRAQERFLREIALAARLDHPSIARLYDGGVQQGVCYYAMELVSGGVPLDVYVAQRRLSRREILTLVRDVCVAVHHAHQRLIIHRDLKPSNILVDARDGSPHILDFGLAKELDAGAGGSGGRAVTMEGTVPGTPAFMSPEQASGRSGAVDIRSDVYSLGVILYRLLLGSMPHETSGSSLQIMRRIAEHDARRPRQVDPTIDRDLEAVMLRALARDLEQRYGSAAELADDIDNYLAHRSLRARPRTVLDVTVKWLRRNRARVALSSAVALLVLGMGVWSYVNVSIQRNRAEMHARTAEAVLDFMVNQVFKGADPHANRGHQPSVRDLLDNGASKLGQSLADQPLVQASVRNAIGRVYMNLGLSEQAIYQMEQALALNRRHLGETDPQTLRAALGLVFAYEGAGRMNEARSLLLTIMDTLRSTLGEDHPDTLESLHRLGNVMIQLGDLDRAAQLLDDALSRRMRVLGEEHPDTIWSMSDLGAVRSLQGRFDEAERLLRRALELRRKVDPESFEVLNSEMNLATTLLRMKRFDESEQLLQSNIASRARMLGPEHPDSVLPLHRLGMLRFEQGRFDEAERMLRQSFDTRRKVEPHSPTTLNSAIELARALEAQDRADDAAELRRELARIVEEMMATPDLVDVRWLRGYARDLSDSGRRDDAVELLRRAMKAGFGQERADRGDNGAREEARMLLQRMMDELTSGPSAP